MATVTGLTAARMAEIEAAAIVAAEVVDGNLILERHDGTPIDAGPVTGPAGPAGPTGPGGGSIPGEVRLWPGSVLPLLATYGKWVWADGAVYVSATYPIAAGHISTAWRTFDGASDPGAGNFRVPDLRGLVPAGLDQMPGGVRANRMTRAVAITLAAKTGKETHVIALSEMAAHDHGGGNHEHDIYYDGNINQPGTGQAGLPKAGNAILSGAVVIQHSGNIITSQGTNGAHENIQPSVMVPYIVKLDG